MFSEIQNNKIAIVGSGFLGLTLALRLSEAGAKVTVFESSGEIGGLAARGKSAMSFGTNIITLLFFLILSPEKLSAN